MKANISHELEKLIDEKIYLDLELHILTKRFEQATKPKDIDYFEERLNLTLKEIKSVKDLLRKENVKICEPIQDGIFIEYHFYVKTNGGFKEGDFRYWKEAMKYNLKKRLNFK
jgi:hypothetical protein